MHKILQVSGGNDVLEHKIEQCLIQLASVDSSIFVGEDVKRSYASQFLSMIQERFAR